MYCSECAHWDMDFVTFARTASGVERACQCMAVLMDADRADDAPQADTGGPELPIFTYAHNHCGAFAMAPELQEGYASVAATDAALDIQLHREAWGAA